MKRVTVLYFASLREKAGLERESVESGADDLAGLYAQLDAAHALGWPRDHLRVAVDGGFARWHDALVDGSEIVFIPPVSGG